MHHSFRHCRESVVVVLRSPIHANEPSEYNGMLYRTSNRVLNNGIKVIILICMDGTSQYHHYPGIPSFVWVVVVLRSPIHANEPSEYNGMLYHTYNRVLNNGIKVIILICMDGTSQYHHHHLLSINRCIPVLHSIWIINIWRHETGKKKC